MAAKMPRLIADGTVTWYFLFAAWSAIFIAMTQQQRARLTERRAGRGRDRRPRRAGPRAALPGQSAFPVQHAQQPQSSLVMSGRADRAEEMLMALSTFFRTSLSLDPSADVTLAAGNRPPAALSRHREDPLPRAAARSTIDVPDDLAERTVPALILQPLVENAIKYGVSATRDPVLLTIAARPLDGGRMQIDVTNRLAEAGPTIPAAVPAHEGTGLGLANVCQRLEAALWRRAPTAASARSRAAIRCRSPCRWTTMTMTEPLRILVADDEPLASERLSLLLGADRRASTLVGTAHRRRPRRSRWPRQLDARRRPARHRHARARRDRGRARACRGCRARRRWCSSPPSTSSRSPRSKSPRSII